MNEQRGRNHFASSEEYLAWRETGRRHLLDSCSLPIYGLSATWAGKRRAIVEAASSDLADENFPVPDSLVSPMTVELVTASHEAPDGGRLFATTRRRGGPADPVTSPQLSTAIWIHRFLQTMNWSPSARERLTEMPDELSDIGADFLRPPTDSEWRDVDLYVDMRPTTGRLLTIRDSWLILEPVPGVDLAIEGHQFPSDSLELFTVNDPVAWSNW